MDVLTISKQYANSRAGLLSGPNIIPGSTTTVAGNVAVTGFLASQNLLVGSSSQCVINNTGILQLNGTTSGTILQLLNTTSPIPDFAGFGVTVGSSLDVYANNSHKWWLGSSANSPGFNTMQLKSGMLSLGGVLSTTGVTMSGSLAGTMLQLINVRTVSNASTQTTAYAAIGVTPGTALENFALTSHRWWTGSSGTSSGTLSMQITSGTLICPATMICNTLTVQGNITQNAWRPMTLLNGWSNNAFETGTTYTVAQYLLDPLGFVHIRGLVVGGTMNTAIANLPVGFRPPRVHIISASANDAWCEVRVSSNGDIVPSYGNPTWVSMDNIHFCTT